MLKILAANYPLPGISRVWRCGLKTNHEIAEIFNSMADILEIGDVEWKPRAYRNAAKSLETLGRDAAEIYREGGLRALEEIPGIGGALGQKIIEYVEGGKIREYEKLKKTLPPGMRDLLKVPGLGPYRAENLYHHGISSVAGLKTAVQKHQLAAIPGFGEKSERKIAGNLGVLKPHGDRRPWAQVMPWAEKVTAYLGPVKAVERLEVVGSLRRGEETVGDIDILAVSRQPEKVMDAFVKMPFVSKVVLRGPKKSEVVLENGLQVDLRVFEKESFGAAMIYFTGDKQHNIALRKIAIAKGWKLNEYGLFDKSGKVLAGRTEQEVYARLGYRLIPPGRRKSRGELDAPEFILES
jgi:DNA polymerase (family X)